MINLIQNSLENTSTKTISFLKDVSINFKFDKKGKFYYYYIPISDHKYIYNYIHNLEKNSFYTMIPLISLNGLNEDPHLILSKQILLTNYSNPVILNQFILKQIDKAITDYEINLDNKYYYLIFKYKKIILI